MKYIRRGQKNSRHMIAPEVPLDHVITFVAWLPPLFLSYFVDFLLFGIDWTLLAFVL